MLKLGNKKVYKTKKALDTANKHKGELGRKQKTIKYIIEQYINLFKNEIDKTGLIDSLESIHIVFFALREVLIKLKKEHKILELDLPTLLTRDMLLLLLTPEGEEAHFDYAQKYSNNPYTHGVMQMLCEFQDGKPLKGYGIALDFDDELDLMSLFEANGFIQRADNAIVICKWLMDTLKQKQEELSR